MANKLNKTVKIPEGLESFMNLDKAGEILEAFKQCDLLSSSIRSAENRLREDRRSLDALKLQSSELLNSLVESANGLKGREDLDSFLNAIKDSRSNPLPVVISKSYIEQLHRAFFEIEKLTISIDHAECHLQQNYSSRNDYQNKINDYNLSLIKAALMDHSKLVKKTAKKRLAGTKKIKKRGGNEND